MKNKKTKCGITFYTAMLSVMLLVGATFVGCVNPTPIPVPAAFIEKPVPADGAVNVAQPVAVSWDYVGDGKVPMNFTFDVLVNGAVAATNQTAMSCSVPLQPPLAQVSWQVIVHTAYGNGTSVVYKFTTISTNSPVIPTNPVVSTVWRGRLFTDGALHPNLGNNHGVRSQMDYRDCHHQPNEGQIRDAEMMDVLAGGGNIYAYILGNSNRGNAVLDMCLNGRKHPQDGHYFPIANPLTSSTEADSAMYYFQKYGLKPLCWIWNDDNSMPVNEQTVADAVATYDGTRLGMQNVALGVCLEANEIMPSPAQGAQALSWIKKYAPQSMIIIGSQSADWLVQVAATAPAGCYYWIEQDGNPVTQPLTLADCDARLFNKAAKVASKVGAAHTICGEHWSSDDATRKAITAKIESLGYIEGSGQWK